jgi:hypothetical protein
MAVCRREGLVFVLVPPSALEGQLEVGQNLVVVVPSIQQEAAQSIPEEDLAYAMEDLKVLLALADGQLELTPCLVVVPCSQSLACLVWVSSHHRLRLVRVSGSDHVR